MTTGLVHDPAFEQHDTGPGHPESAARAERIHAHLRAQPWFDQLVAVPAQPAGEAWIHTIHDPRYVERARAACRRGDPFLDTPDVAISGASFDCALLATGGALALADALMAGRVDNGFAILRPPGHHAEHAAALGFCLFNNVAVLARYLQRAHGLDKILILDWDVHHGNGTQHSFEDDPSVMYISTHQYPYYPGTGAASERGSGRGSGATVNCPMPAGATDDAYMRAFMEVILPAADLFKPEAVLISAGFDAHYSDPLAAVNLSTGMYRWMSERMLEVADQHAGGRLLSLLEGGYNLEHLPLCAAAHLRALLGVAEPRQTAS